MKQELFTVAQFVQEYSGKLVIVGTFDVIKTTAFPFFFPGFGVAAVVLGDHTDYGKTYDVTLTLRKVGMRKPLFEANFKMEFKKKRRGHLRPAAQACVMIGPVTKFNSPGVYLVEMKAGGGVVCEKRILVGAIAAPPEGNAKRTKKKRVKKKIVKKKILKKKRLKKKRLDKGV